MDKPVKILIVLIGLFVFGVLSILAFSLIRLNSQFKVASERVTQIATELDYKPENLVAIRRNTSLMGGYDTVNITYSTNLSREAFMDKIQKLGYKQEYPYNEESDSDFLFNINNGAKPSETVFLGKHYGVKTYNPFKTEYEPNLKLEEYPSVYSVQLKSLTNEEFKVSFATTNKVGDKWTRNGKPLLNNMVTLTFYLW